MASSTPNPGVAPGPGAGNGPATAHPDITDASHALYRDGQLVWDNGKLADEDIVVITNSDNDENERVIWSLAPVDPASEPDKATFALERTSASAIPRDFLERHVFQALPEHLDPDTHNLYVLISTRSGTGLALDFFHETLRPLLQAIGLAESKYEVVQTENAKSVKTFARSTLLKNANKGTKQTLLLLSGDGGIVDTVNGLLDEENKLRYVFFNSDCCLSLTLWLKYLCQPKSDFTSPRYRKCPFPFITPPFHNSIHICSRAANSSPRAASHPPCLSGDFLSRCAFPV